MMKEKNALKERTMGRRIPLRTAALLLLSCLLPLVFSGCAQTITHLIDPDETYEKEGAAYSDSSFRDKASLYEDDDAEVLTLYLTVGQGNEEDGTNHTWTEVNSHAIGWYEERGIEPYACEAGLQVGDENGPGGRRVRLRGDGGQRGHPGAGREFLNTAPEELPDRYQRRKRRVGGSEGDRAEQMCQRPHAIHESSLLQAAAGDPAAGQRAHQAGTPVREG